MKADDPARIYSPEDELLIPKHLTEKPTGKMESYPLDKWKEWRQLGRTQAQWLANEVLGYRDVDVDNVFAHRAMAEAMQQFVGGRDTADNITLDHGAGYQPFIPMWDLEYGRPDRQALILCSRLFLKTSFFVITHAIQWIINYPWVRILFSSGTGAQLTRLMSIIVQHFRYNETFRWFYPEFVPHGKEIAKFGSTESMTIRQSIRQEILGEPTVGTASVGAVIAGPHQDIHFHDDVVDKENVRTPTGLQQVTAHLQATAPLLERRPNSQGIALPGWKFITGTRYHYADPYGLIIDEERAKPKEKRQYVIVFAPAWTGRWGTDDAKATWPSRYPISELQRIENDPLQGPEILHTQYGLRPRPGKSGLVESREDIRFDPPSILTKQFIETLRIHHTVDLHGFARGQQSVSVRRDNDFTAVTTAGFAPDGHCYVLRIWHGRPTPSEVIDYLFSLWFDFPRSISFKIPKDMLGNQLNFWLQREQMKRQRFLPIEPMPIDNQQSKEQKNRALQPWFKAGIISFSDLIACKQALIDEIMRFPKYHDDILDTLRDQMENRDAGIEASAQQVLLPRAPQVPLNLGEPRKFIGFGENGEAQWAARGDETVVESADRITGW